MRYNGRRQTRSCAEGEGKTHYCMRLVRGGAAIVGVGLGVGWLVTTTPLVSKWAMRWSVEWPSITALRSIWRWRRESSVKWRLMASS